MIQKPLPLVTLVVCLVYATLGYSEVLSTIYFHNNALGSPVAATNETGDILWREHYRPYGEKMLNPNTDNRLWYTGHAHDAETGLTYMGARYYDPLVGRFMAIDPVDFVETSPQSFNRYVYANNNPYRYVDPDGEFSIEMTGNDRINLKKDPSLLRKGIEKHADKLPFLRNVNTILMGKAIKTGQDLHESLSRTGPLSGKSGEQYWNDIENFDRLLEQFFKTKEGSEFIGFNHADKFKSRQWTAVEFQNAMRKFGDYLQKRDGNRGPLITRFKEIYGSPWETGKRNGLLRRESDRSGLPLNLPNEFQ